MIWVMIPHEGISPEDSERLIVRPMEFELKRLEGIEELDAYASEGSATIVVEFDSNFDQDQALLDVREAVAEQDDGGILIACFSGDRYDFGTFQGKDSWADIQFFNEITQ